MALVSAWQSFLFLVLVKIWVSWCWEWVIITCESWILALHIFIRWLATHPALLLRNLIGWSSGRITHPARWSAAKQNSSTKIVSKSSESFGSYKTGENAFDKTLERSFFGKFSVSFVTIFGKFKNQQKALGKWFWSNFVKNIFSGNCRKIVRECSEYFRFYHLINYLLTILLVMYREILSLRFLRTDLASSVVLQNLGLSISRYGPHIRLINSKL